MKSNVKERKKILASNKQFTIPIYQRRHSWTLEQCEKLCLDIKNIANI